MTTIATPAEAAGLLRHLDDSSRSAWRAAHEFLYTAPEAAEAPGYRHQITSERAVLDHSRITAERGLEIGR